MSSHLFNGKPTRKSRISLAAILVLLLAWFGSVLGRIGVLIPTTSGFTVLLVGNGGIVYRAESSMERDAENKKREDFFRSLCSPRLVWHHSTVQFGFTLPRYRTFNTASHRCTTVNIPTWMLLVLFLIPISVSYYLLRKREYASSMACIHCGYDLFENVSGICPECGRPSNSKG